MRYILGLDLTNVVTFKKLSVDFNEGLYYLRGLNIDADPVNPTGNGAGKTLMFSTIANLIYQSTPMALKKKSKRDILRQRGSAVGMILRQSIDGPEYEIIQTSKGYKIYEDGKDLELRTIPLAEEFIHKLFPMSETKFYSTCYLSTQRPYVLQRDTDSNRLGHITDIFNLDQYSGIRDVLALQLRAIKDDELKLSVLSQHLIGLRKKRSELVSSTTKAEYLSAKKSYTSVGKQMDSVQASIFELTTKQRDLESLLTIERLLDGLRGDYKFKVQPNKMLARLKEQRSASLQWDRWTQRSQQATAMIKKLDKKIAELVEPSTDIDALKARKSTCEKAIRKAENEISELLAVKKSRTKTLAALADLQADLDALGLEGKIPDGDHASDLAVLRVTLKLERLLDHEHDDAFSCPTCLTELDLKTIRQTVASAKKKIKTLTKYVDAARLLADIKKLSDSVADFDENRLDELNAIVEKKQRTIDKTVAAISDAQAYASLIEQREEIEIPEQPESEEPKYSVSEIDEHVDLCVKIVDALSQKDLLLSNHAELSDLRTEAAVESELTSVTEKVTSLTAKFSKLRGQQSTDAGIVTAYEQYRNTGNVYSKELIDVQAKIDALTPGIENKKLLEILLKAYGSKGLRATAADSVCRLLQTNLNHYRDLIFAEPFSFEVVASETGISILVDRNNGKPDSVSDVRNLSGAESNSFQLLCLVSLLPLLPDSERVNLVILDEPTSHMDEVSRSIFNDRFVPVLREIVPSVYIISPHKDDVSPNSKEWIVKKQNGVSSLQSS